MNYYYIVSVCFFLCAVTSYAHMAMRKYVVDTCKTLMDEFTRNNMCKEYTLTNNLQKIKHEFKNTPYGILWEKVPKDFEQTCCVLELNGILTPDAILNIPKLKEFFNTHVLDDNMKQIFSSCLDKELQTLTADEMDILRTFHPLSKCLYCNCWTSYLRKAFEMLLDCYL